jgi:hypothetical protein
MGRQEGGDGYPSCLMKPARAERALDSHLPVVKIEFKKEDSSNSKISACFRRSGLPEEYF